MRILQISSSNTFGGGERHLLDLTRELVHRGHDVFVALRPTNEWQSRFDFLPPENIFHVSIRNSFGMFSANKIGRFADEKNIDIIHAHVARDYIPASIATRKTRRSKLILTRHVMFPMKPFQRFALGNVSAAIAVAPGVAVHLGKIFTREKVRIIPNGLRFSASSEELRKTRGAEFRDFHQIPEDALLVVTLGELRLLKGQRDLVLAANEVLKKHPSCLFVVAGRDNSIDQRFRRELKRLVKVFGNDENFLWLDWLDDTLPLLSAADIFVSPSHTESFGLAILDAMAAGAAVIATDTNGARELIADAAKLVPVKDPLALASEISKYVEDENLRGELGRQLAVTARESFGLERMIDATEALYKEIAGVG